MEPAMEPAGSERPIQRGFEKFLKFDDSPEKLSYELFADGIGPSDAMFIVQEFPLELSDLLSHGKDSESTFISMKKPGHGTKRIKDWAKNLSSSFLVKDGEVISSDSLVKEGPASSSNLQVKESSSDSQMRAFWRDSYQNWTIYQQFQPKVLVASDVLESMQLRLTYFLQTEENSKLVTMKWFPFEHGIGQVSYAKLIWHYFHKEKDNSWIESAFEKDWIEFCLYYSEIGYIRDLESKGYVLDMVDETTQAFDIRKEMVRYVTVLKQDRNIAAHMFCSAIKQRTIQGEQARPKVRALLDTPVHDLSSGMQGNLLRMIEDLKVNPPEIFQELKLCFKMQLYFLQSVLEISPSLESLHHGIHDVSQHNPPPPEFPRHK